MTGCRHTVCRSYLYFYRGRRSAVLRALLHFSPGYNVTAHAGCPSLTAATSNREMLQLQALAGLGCWGEGGCGKFFEQGGLLMGVWEDNFLIDQQMIHL